MMEYIKADLNRYFKNQSKPVNPSAKKKIRIILETYGVHAIFIYRFGHVIGSEIIDKKIYFIKHLLLGAYYILNFLVIKM